MFSFIMHYAKWWQLGFNYQFRGVIKVLYFANNWLRTTVLRCSFILATAYKDSFFYQRNYLEFKSYSASHSRIVAFCLTTIHC